MELLRSLLLEKPTDREAFLGFAEERWKGNFKRDAKLLNQLLDRNDASELIDFLGDFNHIKGGFNREKILMKTKGRSSTQEILKILSKEAAWKRFSGPKSFKGF